MQASRCSLTVSLLMVTTLLGSLVGQQAPTVASSAPVPQLVNYSGKPTDEQGRPIAGIAGITFSIYKDQYDGVPLWMETQNIHADAKGNYTVHLGAMSAEGLPLDLFTSGEARWLGVRVNGGEEPPRVLLLSVPYALKAADAQTLGGLPASAFVLAAPASGAAPSAPSNGAAELAQPALAGTGTTDYVPLWTPNGSTLGDSVLFQSGTGTAAKIGINTTTPASTLDVTGPGTVRGNLSLPATGTATATSGEPSQPATLTASAYNSNAKGAVAQNFRWQAEPAGNHTAAPKGTLNLLYSSGTAAAAQTGLMINSKGLLTFAAGQAFPGTGAGMITGVTAGTDLTGGGTSGTVTLDLNTTKVPQLAASNTFTGNQTVNGNLSATGVVTGSSYQIGSNLFAFGSFANQNAFLGFAGNTTMTGGDNTAIGLHALHSNAQGYGNMASGAYALYSNTPGIADTVSGAFALYANTTGTGNTATGSDALREDTTGYENTASGLNALYGTTTGNDNTASGAYALFSNRSSSNMASGAYALYSNTTGSSNTAIGTDALYNNFVGSYNTAVGAIAGPDPSTPGFTNSTAIGAFADVAESNALVLGSTAAQNGIANVLVGIDVSSPTNILTVLQGGGNAIADGWSTYSSRRWKTNIHLLENALSKVEQLRGVSYDLKDSGKHEIGVIAEEVGQVVPEVVSYENNGKDARGVDYSRLTALLRL